jgi:hypothetical protein
VNCSAGAPVKRGRRARAEESGALHPSILGPDDVPLLPFRGGSGHASNAFLDHGREHARPAEQRRATTSARTGWRRRHHQRPTGAVLPQSSSRGKVLRPVLTVPRTRRSSVRVQLYLFTLQLRS